MDRKEVITSVTNYFGDKIVCNETHKQQFEILVSRDDTLSLLNWLKEFGFNQLAIIFSIDWIDDNEFELVYNLSSYEYKLNVFVKTRINREKPWMHTALNLWGLAQVYEQEVHEMFGIYFAGNPNLEPLILHNWHDIPPLRKDFDPKEFSLSLYTLEAMEEYAENKEEE